jgi:hypothetical protein
MEAQLLKLELPTLGTGNNPRSPGLHLTDVIRDLLKTSGIETSRPMKWNSITTMSAGFIWEEVLFSYWEELFSPAFARLMGRKYNWYQVGELNLEDITGTPDGLDVTATGLVLQEAKFTWKSAKTKPADRLNWMIQGKGYLKMLFSRMLQASPQILFHVFYCMGDWKGSGPIYEPWLLTFTPAEIEENWQMLKNHADFMRSR